MSKLFIVIPAFNEAQSIGQVLKNLKQCGYKNIIVVDDGSKDNTAEISFAEGATVLSHLINRGQGAALKTGTEYALRNGADIIVHFDADGQMQPEDIKTIVEPLISGKADVCFGSRFINNTSNIPLLRKLLLKLGKIFMKIFFGVSTTDPQSGFRAMTKDAAKKIEIKQRGMPHCSEILEQVRRKKMRFVEAPVTILYTEYSKKHGQSNTAAVNIAAKLVWSKLIR